MKKWLKRTRPRIPDPSDAFIDGFLVLCDHKLFYSPASEPIYVSLKKRFCMSCGERMPLDAKFCPRCGMHPILNEPKFCKNCGAIIPIPAKFCNECGARQPPL